MSYFGKIIKNKPGHLFKARTCMNSIYKRKVFMVREMNQFLVLKFLPNL